MKKSDWAMLILIAASSLFVAYFVMNAIFGQFGKNKAEVPVVAPIKKTIVAPDTNIFNSEAINPTVQVVIGGSDS